MPLFEFICDDCGTRFEELVMGEREVGCAKCGSKDVRKQFSTFAGRTAGSPSSSARTAPAVPT